MGLGLTNPVSLAPLLLSCRIVLFRFPLGTFATTVVVLLLRGIVSVRGTGGVR
jgi:hypothetical protein